MLALISVFLITVVAGQVLSPACYDNCVLSSCTDLTHLNCVCNNEANTINLCVLASCDATDQILAQQAQASVCGNFSVTSTSSASNPSASSSQTSTSSALSSTFSAPTVLPSSAVSSTMSFQTALNSIVPTPTESATTSSSGLSTAAKGGIAGGVVGGVLLFVGLIGFFILMRRRKAREQELRSGPLPPYEERKEVEMSNLAALKYPEDTRPEEVGARLRNEDGVPT